jgi:hypothetical protein
MRDDKKPYPGPWRVMHVDSGVVGIAIAAGFVVLGLVSMPILFLGAVPLGLAVALFLHFSKR